MRPGEVLVWVRFLLDRVPNTLLPTNGTIWGKLWYLLHPATIHHPWDLHIGTSSLPGSMTAHPFPAFMKLWCEWPIQMQENYYHLIGLPIRSHVALNWRVTVKVGIFFQHLLGMSGIMGDREGPRLSVTTKTHSSWRNRMLMEIFPARCSPITISICRRNWLNPNFTST